MSNLSIDITAAIKSGTKKWTAEKRKADRAGNLHQRQYRQFYQYSDRVTITEVVFDILEAAYNKVSSNGKYYANARQIMYACRPEILDRTGRDELLSATFQKILKDYLEQNNPLWKIAWDARGHIIEPHTNKMIGLGGIDVDKYIHSWNTQMIVPVFDAQIDTDGPANRFKNVLFIEKEGFTEILMDAGFQEIYDMALMSTKGMPVKAACDLIYEMSSKEDVRVFVLHDFDCSGFKILNTLRDGVRLSRGTDVIDLGLRIADIERFPTEPVSFPHQNKWPGYKLREYGCTAEEIEFLCGNNHNWGNGQRVEINTMTSEQLVTWLHKKLKEVGAKKFIPDNDMLTKGYQFTKKIQNIKDAAECAEKVWDKHIKENPDGFPSPKNLSELIELKLTIDPKMSWDQAVWDIIADEEKEMDKKYGGDEKG
jgi:5S rRNA maturation endonuclease (ribonuclease M5)